MFVMNHKLGFCSTLLASAVLVTACGSSSRLAGSNPTASEAARAATADGHPPPATGVSASDAVRSARDEAVAFAHAVNLRAADVPGFTVASPEHNHETTAEKHLEHEMLHCVAAGSGKSVGEASSPEFKYEHGLLRAAVNSEVSVARSSAVAAEELRTIRSTHARRCLSHYLNLIFKGKAYQGATVAPVSIVSGTPRAPGATGSFGWGIRTTVTAHAIKVPIYIGIFVFTYGPAEVSLFTSATSAPFPAAAQRRLFSLLLQRAKTHRT
jgi:hypothetical protein